MIIKDSPNKNTVSSDVFELTNGAQPADRKILPKDVRGSKNHTKPSNLETVSLDVIDLTTDAESPSCETASLDIVDLMKNMKSPNQRIPSADGNKLTDDIQLSSKKTVSSDAVELPIITEPSDQNPTLVDSVESTNETKFFNRETLPSDDVESKNPTVSPNQNTGLVGSIELTGNMKSLNRKTASSDIDKLNNNISAKQKITLVNFVDLMNSINSSDEKSVDAVELSSSSKSQKQTTSPMDVVELTNITESPDQTTVATGATEMTNTKSGIEIRTESLHNETSTDIARVRNNADSSNPKAMDVVESKSDTEPLKLISSSVDVVESNSTEPVTQKIAPVNIVELTNKAIWMNVMESLNNTDSSDQKTIWMKVAEFLDSTESTKKKVTSVDVAPLKNIMCPNQKKTPLGWETDVAESSNKTDSSSQSIAPVEIVESTKNTESLKQKTIPLGWKTDVVESSNKTDSSNQNTAPVEIDESTSSTESSKQKTICMDVTESSSSTDSTYQKAMPEDVVAMLKNIVSPNQRTIPLGWKTDVVETSNKTDSSNQKTAPVEIIEATDNTNSANAETDMMDFVEVTNDTEILDLNISGIAELTNNIESSNEETDSMDVVEAVADCSNAAKTTIEVVDLTTPGMKVNGLKRECCTPTAPTPKSCRAKVKSVKKESMPSTPVARPGKRKAFGTPKSGHKAKKKVRTELASTRCPLPDNTYTEIGDVSTSETFVSVRGKVIYSSRIHKSTGIAVYFDMADETGIIRVFGGNKVAFLAKKHIIVGNTLRLIHVKVEPRTPRANNLDHRCELHLNEDTDIIWEINSRLKNGMSLKVKFIPYADVGKYGSEEYFDLTGKIVDFSAASPDGRRSITISDGRRYELKVCFRNWYIPVHETMIGLPIDILRCYYSIVEETVEATGAHVKIDGRPVIAYHHTYLDFF